MRSFRYICHRLPPVRRFGRQTPRSGTDFSVKRHDGNGMGFHPAALRRGVVRDGDRTRPGVPGEGRRVPHAFSGGARQRVDDGRVAVRIRGVPGLARRTAARSQPDRGAGRERYRVHRRRDDHHSPATGAGTDHGGESLGHGGYRTRRRSAHVYGCGRSHGADPLRAGGADARVRGTGAAADDDRLLGGRPGVRSMRCSPGSKAAIIR